MGNSGSVLRQKTGYLPSLDGWRALAVIGVVLTHDQGGKFPFHVLERVRDIGFVGVDLFFAISGVLVTWRILEDEKTRGYFGIKSFYVRRFFRIQPAAWTYLGVLAVLMLCGALQEKWSRWFGALLLFRNFQAHWADRVAELGLGWFSAHFWTLSLEEHFYILLSIFILTVRRNRVVVLFTLLFGLIVGQQIAMRHGLFSEDVSGGRTYWQIQYLFFGAFLSILLQVEWFRQHAVRWLRPWPVFVVGFLLLEVHSYVANAHLLGPFNLIGEHASTIAYLFAFCVVATMLHPSSWTTRFLELSPLRFIGRISYSLYLWQQLVFHSSSSATVVRWRPLVWAGGRPQNYLVLFALALLSYFCIEKPFVRLGHKLAPPSTPGHRDLDVSSSPRSAPAIPTMIA
jgi:peptidoglycan/LPS O-acetylase OafA/YrhL